MLHFTHRMSEGTCDLREQFYRRHVGCRDPAPCAHVYLCGIHKHKCMPLWVHDSTSVHLCPDGCVCVCARVCLTVLKGTLSWEIIQKGPLCSDNFRSCRALYVDPKPLCSLLSVWLIMRKELRIKKFFLAVNVVIITSVPVFSHFKDSHKKCVAFSPLVMQPCARLIPVYLSYSPYFLTFVKLLKDWNKFTFQNSTNMSYIDDLKLLLCIFSYE